MRDLMFIIVPFCFHTLPMSKLSILNEKNEAIVGILEKKPEIDEGRPQPRVVLIVHGILGWFFCCNLMNPPQLNSVH